jgi:hypothetical protein
MKHEHGDIDLSPHEDAFHHGVENVQYRLLDLAVKLCLVRNDGDLFEVEHFLMMEVAQIKAAQAASRADAMVKEGRLCAKCGKDLHREQQHRDEHSDGQADAHGDDQSQPNVVLTNWGLLNNSLKVND